MNRLYIGPLNNRLLPENSKWTNFDRTVPRSLVKKLIVAGSNLNARSYSLTTPLHEAACNNHLLVAKILILSGCEVDPTGK